MLWKLKTLGLLLAVTQCPIILCLGPGNSSTTRCRKCHLDSQSKITAKIRQMEKEAQELFNSYLDHQGFVHDLDQYCYEPVEWFPAGNITAQPRALMLQELKRTMARMSAALQHIKKQQETLNKPGAKLLRKLQSASWAVRGLLSNIHCALCLLGTVTSPTAINTPERPATMRAFQHKTEGCKVLWNYSRFLKALVQGSGRKDQQAGTNKRRWKSTRKRQASRA